MNNEEVARQLMLFVGIDHNDLNQVEEMLRLGANPNGPVWNGFSALYVAATMAGDRYEIVEALLRAGGRPNELTREGLSCLYVAAQMGNERCVRALARAGADVNFTTRGYGATPLINAAEEDKLRVVKALVELGANVNRRNKMGETALGVAIKNGNHQVACYLESHGAVS